MKSKMVAGKTDSNLLSLGLIEKDTNEDTLWTWTYPSVEKEFKDLLMKKCSQSSNDLPENQTSCFGQFKSKWYYLTTFPVKENAKLPLVTSATLVVISKEFNPELYNAIGNVLLKSYLKSGTPISMLQAFLSLFTRGFCEDEADGRILAIKDFDKRAAQLKICIKEVIQLFEVETIIIYTALLLKKRVVVFSNKLDTLLHVCRTLPALVWHRNDWNMVFPYSHLEDAELNDLKGKRSYVAGFMDPTVEGRTDLYDIFVNVQEGEIVINPDSKEYFQMGKLHKEIAVSLVESANDEDVTDQAIIKNLAGKTKDILANLKSLAEETEDGTEAKITMDTIKSRNFSAAMQNFLFNLASAENLVKG